MPKYHPPKQAVADNGAVDLLTPKQMELLRVIVDLSQDDVKAYVCLYTAALKAKMNFKEAQHIVYALLESNMLDEFTSDMKVSVTNNAVMYCYHRKDRWIVRLWRTHTESIIRGMFGTVGAIFGAILTLLIKLILHISK
jgi:hypothetical protein